MPDGKNKRGALAMHFSFPCQKPKSTTNVDVLEVQEQQMGLTLLYSRKGVTLQVCSDRFLFAQVRQRLQFGINSFKRVLLCRTSQLPSFFRTVEHALCMHGASTNLLRLT